MKDNLISQGYTPTEQNIKAQLQAINAKGTKGFAVPSMYSYYGAPRNTWHEGIGHMVGDNNPAILDSTPNISIPSNDQYFTDKEKNFIINYLIDCLVEGQPFDCSSLGPNKYLNE